VIHDTRQIDPDLAAIIDAWPGLSPAVRASIAKLAKAASKKGAGRLLNKRSVAWYNEPETEREVYHARL
jgi:hypothetical protein